MFVHLGSSPRSLPIARRVRIRKSRAGEEFCSLFSHRGAGFRAQFAELRIVKAAKKMPPMQSGSVSGVHHCKWSRLGVSSWRINNWRFVKAVRVGETITASVKVEHVRDDKPICKLETVVRNASGEDCVVGTATTSGSGQLL
ncbi:hypothetical protein QA640_44835 (plasmid) [Bradyrhizobium sp. CB82]|uniref:hypothetical protein n=1 Tax=Bradyrhizobium sp. CB82 TaxID=3039159 RepID=UPI0024B200AF|nr:hypothetical protein [Bradyrhizobium sp. CB82]WFU45925.1 hypothetical protein QA640_44835 [Bradyrhizobium sp. CB82]